MPRATRFAKTGLPRHGLVKLTLPIDPLAMTILVQMEHPLFIWRGGRRGVANRSPDPYVAPRDGCCGTIPLGDPTAADPWDAVGGGFTRGG